MPDRVEQRLVPPGVGPVGVTSRPAPPVGQPTPPGRDEARTENLDARRSSAVEVLRVYLAEQLGVLRNVDAALRGDTVHRLRIAARRTRSALRTYRPLFAGGDADSLCEELRWLGAALGEARDAQVLAAHFDATAGGLDGPTSAAVRRRIHEDLAAVQLRAHAAAVETVGGGRYQQLIRAVEELLVSPMFTPEADRPARKVLPRLLARDGRTLRRAVTAAQSAPPGRERDLALHEVRKKAKRLRYAAESATPVLGARARTLAARAQAVQDCLGVHQDTVASRAWLVQLAARSAGDPLVAFGAGRVYALEEHRARRARKAYTKAVSRLPDTRGVRWVAERS